MPCGHQRTGRHAAHATLSLTKAMILSEARGEVTCFSWAAVYATGPKELSLMSRLVERLAKRMRFSAPARMHARARLLLSASHEGHTIRKVELGHVP